MYDFEKSISDILLESEKLIENIDELSIETTIELYDLLEVCAQTSCSNITLIDTKLRVEICKRMDLLLEHIVDIEPCSIQADANIYTPAIQGYRRWGNVELMKDKGLTGYLLAKEIGANAVMLFCTKPEDYPYLSDLPDMQVLYTDTESGAADIYNEYLLKNYAKMDILILHGMYEETILYLNHYRKLRPDGKVYCGLDMNRFWMNHIDWASPSVQQFAAQCDVVATSCRSLRDTLNSNPSVGFACRYFPNGFYDSVHAAVSAEAGGKENTIITVGRIGTPQKNNSELMIAFAKVSHILNNWKLKFIGNIDPEFQLLINEYFTARPDLKDRVIFTGPIVDKAELYKEYAKAKVFALTSQIEGGTPNVYAEALFHGCMFLTSDIDAADDITNFGELGVKYQLGDMDGLTKSLVELCAGADLQAFETHIPKALHYAARYYDWKRNAKKLSYALLKPTIQ